MVMTMATTMNKKIGMKRRKRRKKRRRKKERGGQEEQTPKAGRDTHFTVRSMLLYVHRNHKTYQGREAQNGHLDFRTGPELFSGQVG